MGHMISSARYGRLLTRRRCFWNGVAGGLVLGPGMAFIAYLSCPQCQLPNREGLQLMSYEQRFKNYLDKKYGWYNNADEMFYNQNVNFQRDNEGFAEQLGEMEAKKKAIMEQRVKAILEGTVTK